MIFVVLFSTMSFAINKHYCGDVLVETALLHKAEGCGMEMEKSTTEGCTITKDNCCNDEQLIVDGQDELQQSIGKILFEQQLFFTSFVYTYLNLFEDVDEKASSYKDYKPPLVIKEIYKIDETYLI